MSGEDISRHKGAFLVEAREHVATMNAALLALEKRPADSDAAHEILRAAHTLKSMAAAMDYAQTAGLCHALEDVLVAVRTGSAPLESCTDLLFECFDLLEATLRALTNDQPEPDSAALVEKLRARANGDGQRAGAPEDAPLRDDSHAVRIIDRAQTVAVAVGSSRVDLQACKLEYSIVSPK